MRICRFSLFNITVNILVSYRLSETIWRRRLGLWEIVTGTFQQLTKNTLYWSVCGLIENDSNSCSHGFSVTQMSHVISDVSEPHVHVVRGALTHTVSWSILQSRSRNTAEISGLTVKLIECLSLIPIKYLRVFKMWCHIFLCNLFFHLTKWNRRTLQQRTP